MTRSRATLSLDLDNQWSYMKTHGDAGWEQFPSYLDTLVPHILDIHRDLDLQITVFVVGQDAQLGENHDALAQIPAAGHEVGCHSFHHEPWLHLYSHAQVTDELARAEDAIEGATGVRPNGFRGPGFSLSPTVLSVLRERHYRYDASTLPTYLGPVCRAYYFWKSDLDEEEKEKRKQLYGTVGRGLWPLRPFLWELDQGQGQLLEVPITTLPVAKVPFHVSYILYLSCFAPRLARAYFRNALRICRWFGTEPSILLHPLDFLGGDEVPELAFFPAMNLSGEVKRQRVREYLDDLRDGFDVLPLGRYTDALAREPGLRRRPAARAS